MFSRLQPGMDFCPVSLNLLVFCLGIVFSNRSTYLALAKSDISTNCGSIETSSTFKGRDWIGDKHSKFTTLLQIKGTSTTTTSSTHKFGDPVIYKTARISHSMFLYSFQLNPGPKILRLYFNPTQYKGFTSSDDLFNVEAGHFILLANFSATLTAQALGVNTFTKEYYISVTGNQPLNISFSPYVIPSQVKTYAFINGIEIVSVPEHLTYFNGGDLGARMVGQKYLAYVDNSTALEIIHRLNVKRNSVLMEDEFDMFGISGTLPKQKENGINSLAWKRWVDVGFRYLVRIHFSDLGYKMAQTDNLMLKVLINEHFMESNAVMVKQSDELTTIRHKGYLVEMKGRKQEGQRDISISGQSNNEHIDGDEIVKGFEILKLSNPDNTLASPHPLPLGGNVPSWTRRVFLRNMGYRDTIATIATMMIFVISIILHKLREISEAGYIEEENKPSARAERHCRRFSLAEIQSATRDFSYALIIGSGGFGKVYKGLIDDGQETVAIKRLKAYSRQGRHEFLMEIETLSEHLVSLIGYCNEKKEMILVYEYMPNGTLSDNLYKLERKNKSNYRLTWKERLNICIGAARGLEYLHTGHRVIHRDVKTSNILLNENFIAKVADFGLAKPEDRSKLQSYISTNVKGTPGYFDPYYMSTCKLTRKSDTYAFGVVLFEVLCGRPAMDQKASKDEHTLTIWARNKIKKGEFGEILDSNLTGEISTDSLKTLVEVAESCLHDEPKKRPTMAQVVTKLEFALEQQERKKLLADEIDPSDDEQVTVVRTDVQPVSPIPVKQTNNEIVNIEPQAGYRNRRKLAIRPWDLMWNVATPFKRKILCQNLPASWVSHDNGVGGAQGLKGLRCFLYDELEECTNNFSEVNYIGSRGYGKIYKGKLSSGEVVAIKKAAHQDSKLEFKTEIEVLSRVHHKNIVSLVGICFEQAEQNLVYEYMPSGTFREILSGKTGIQIDWKKRILIALGSATGLNYLHELAYPPIIHRNFSSRNILLDENLTAKVADITFSKLLSDSSEGYTSTVIKGNLGYLDPEYFITGELTKKSDVYSFGVVMLELITAKQASGKETLLVQDVKKAVVKNDRRHNGLRDIIDPAIRYKILIGFSRFLELALQCVQESASNRPTMHEIVKSLKIILQNQGQDTNSTSSSNIAFGSRKGALSHHHGYSSPSMMDDDETDVFGSIGGNTVSIRVLVDKI